MGVIVKAEIKINVCIKNNVNIKLSYHNTAIKAKTISLMTK